MVNAAVIENDTVTNLIYVDEENFDAFNAGGWELLQAEGLGLLIGDNRIDGVWYRNGEPLPLTGGEYDELADARAALLELGVNPDE